MNMREQYRYAYRLERRYKRALDNAHETQPQEVFEAVVKRQLDKEFHLLAKHNICSEAFSAAIKTRYMRENPDPLTRPLWIRKYYH